MSILRSMLFLLLVILLSGGVPNLQAQPFTGADIVDGSLHTEDLANGAVTGSKLAPGAVGTGKLVIGAVRTARLADEAVTEAKLSADLQDLINRLERLLELVRVEEGEINSLSGPHIVIEGANLHIRAGNGNTSASPNGSGNLIVGYNEEQGSGNARSGSHNLVIGQEHSYTSVGGFVAGRDNNVTGPFASVCGGRNNTASGNNSSISGGRNNTASAFISSVSGGRGQTVSGNYDWRAGAIFYNAADNSTTTSALTATTVTITGP